MCKNRKQIFDQDLQIFSKEICYDNTYGKRNYLVTNYIHFFKRYSLMNKQNRCYYEVILENYKCKLYFDIEYNKEYNKNTNGQKLINIFTKYLISHIFQELNILINKCDIIDLDSSTNIKFSRHLIIVFPSDINTVFKNNQSCGIFVRKMCDKLRQMCKKGLYYYSEAETQIILENKELDKLFIYDIPCDNCSDYNRVLFIDECVYTKNRCFRLIYSSKLKYIHTNNGNYLTYTSNQDRKIKTNKYTATFKDKFIDFMDTLVCAINVNENTKIISFEGEIYSYSLSHNKCNIDFGYLNFKSSPYQLLDNWIKKVVNKWGRYTCPWIDTMNKIPIDINNDNILYDAIDGCGKITKWNVFKDKNDNVSTMIYNVDKNRYCMNVARCHKSNGIYFLVNFDDS